MQLQQIIVSADNHTGQTIHLFILCDGRAQFKF